MFNDISADDLVIGQEIDRGGFGVVYQAQWKKHVQVAVKQLHLTKFSEGVFADFQHEMAMMSQLHSPQIVQLYGACLSSPYRIVMEFMPNGSLHGVLHSTKPLDWPERQSIALDIAKGLAFLHNHNPVIIHRDLKSHNVLLTKHLEAKLSDFGLAAAKSETSSNTYAHKVKPAGTLFWMAPELFSLKGSCTRASDVYSYGMTLWEIASREQPYKNVTDATLLKSCVQEGEREEIPVGTPSEIGKEIVSCWEGDPKKRPIMDDVVMRLQAINPPLSQVSNSSGPHYQLNSTPSSAVAKPLVFSAVDRHRNSRSSSSSAQVLPPVIAKSSQVNVKMLSTFLKHVADGEQDQAEAMLKKTPNLALSAGAVTDLSGRLFAEITGFQYAVWALDWHMWTMIEQYMSEEAIREQIQGLETGSWVKQHGKSASWQNLLYALDKFVELRNSEFTSVNKGTECWQKQVGSAQRLLPAHVVNEYCRPDRPFEPCPSFMEVSLPRTRNTDKGEWYTASYNSGKLGETFAYIRTTPNASAESEEKRYGKGETAGEAFLYMLGEGNLGSRGQGWVSRSAPNDRAACHTLLVIRTQQRDQLLAQYSKKPNQPCY